ncbi:MAG: anaerobic ribonucleoside-triphosphate reductase activating protein [Candidatus Sigynarchaeota archaeon]
MVEDKGLYIAGMKSQSLVDEPGKAVAIIYLQGCNLDCGFCHNSALIPMFTKESKKITVDQLLENLAGNFLIDGVVFTGGEPLLQPNIIDFVKAVKAKIPFVAVDTNGTNPVLLAQVSPLLDRVAMDVKTAMENYPKVVRRNVNVDNVRESIDILCERSRKIGRVEFRFTYAPPANSIDDIMAIADHLKHAGFSGKFGSYYVIQQYLPSDGVRKTNRKSYETVVADKLRIIAANVKKYDIPVAIRCQELGYVVA